MNWISVILNLMGAVLLLGYQNSYEVIQERADREYFNNSLTDFTCGVYKSNRTTNALNLTFKLKYTLKNNDMIFVTGYKWLSNEYRLDILQFQDTMRSMINIKYFDINRLFHNYTTPPLFWPTQTGVTYRLFNWIPDSTQFPPGVPEGRWKLRLNFTKADGTIIAVANWYFKIEYKKMPATTIENMKDQIRDAFRTSNETNIALLVDCSLRI